MRQFLFAELSIGQRAEFTVRVTGEMIDEFATLSGDVNALHTDDAHAVERGHPSRVAHGLLTGSFLSTLVGVHLPGKFALLHGVTIAFHAPVYPGDTLQVAGEITHLSEAYRQAELRATVTNQHGKVVAKGKLQVGVDA
jgi:3-hydroxybutyryl-CoA dehydratase